MTLGNERVAYLRQQQGSEVVVAADYGPWTVDYRGTSNGWPREVRVRRREGATIDVTARIGELETNTPIDPRAFSVDVPADAVPMTLDDLGIGRAAGAAKAFMTSLTLPAFAKINLDLRILGSRPDGYHDLRTTFQSLALCDRVTVTKRKGPFVITCDAPQIPTDRRNLVWKATSLLDSRRRAQTGRPRDLAIHIHKRIPVEAGLGGGSADAAVTLLALTRLWKLDLDAATLSRIGARLGADVPFFFVGGTALGLGRGDDIYPLADLPTVHVVVLRPTFGVSTIDAYNWFDQEKRRPRRDAGAAAGPARMAGVGVDPAQRSRRTGDAASPDDCADSPVAARCRRPRRGDVRFRVGGLRHVRARGRRPAHRARPGASGLDGSRHPNR